MNGRNIARGVGGGILGFALVANLFVGARIYSREAPAEDRDEAYDNIALLTKVMDQVRRQYVDADRVGYRDLTYGALRGVLGSLDEHCQFMDPDTFKSMQDDTSGQFGGIGVVVGLRDGALTIIAPMEDTPGFRAGLLSGDRLVELAGKSTEGMDLSEAVKLMRGEAGSKVKIKILRPGEREFRTVEVERAVIEVPSVKDARMLGDGLGYLRITQFDDKTEPALEADLRKLEAEGLRGLILDVRNNPGGLLQAAVEVCSKFLSRGELVVYTQGRDTRERQTFLSRGAGRPRQIPLVVLVNGGSASAAEIVAGCLQDHQRAVLVGERTFGKGSVQTIFPMDDGSALRLTTAKYYTPGERVIHDYGIEPDILIPMSVERWEALMRQRGEAGDFPLRPVAPGEVRPPALPPAADVQLDRALDVLRGILLYRAEAQPPPAKAVVNAKV